MAYRARKSFITKVNGRKRFISEGEFIASSDPIIKARGELFEDLEGTETTRSRTKRTTKRQTTKKSGTKTESAEDTESSNDAEPKDES